jgi:hypothetical protein
MEKVEMEMEMEKVTIERGEETDDNGSHRRRVA